MKESIRRGNNFPSSRAYSRGDPSPLFPLTKGESKGVSGLPRPVGPRNDTIYIVIPSCNEGNRVTDLVKKIKKITKTPIIIVDDGSRERVKESSDFRLLRHKINLGKGAAMKTGAEYAFSQGASAVIFMDGDGQHDPKYLPEFINLYSQGFDCVLASRRPSLTVPLVRLLGNKFASIYINLLFDVYVSDILSGYRLLTHKAYRLLSWSSQRYGVETEMIARLGKHKDKIKWIEFPIESIYIDKYKGVTIIDAVKALFDSIWWKLS
jgi:glycosyltransferase involved in cell wall biosynthesis